MSSSTIQTIEQLLQVLDYMYRHDLKFVEDYRFVFQPLVLSEFYMKSVYT